MKNDLFDDRHRSLELLRTLLQEQRAPLNRSVPSTTLSVKGPIAAHCLDLTVSVKPRSRQAEA
jgi:hypothetical protein